MKFWQQNLRLRLNEQRETFCTVWKYIDIIRVVIERLQITLVPLPALYNHTNHLASTLFGPDMHSVAVCFISARL
jgi:hypothetical protein